MARYVGPMRPGTDEVDVKNVAVCFCGELSVWSAGDGRAEVGVGATEVPILVGVLVNRWFLLDLLVSY